jgi:hypothetical protein
MKFFRSVTITPEHCPPDLYAYLVRLKPDAQRGSIFFLEARPGDGTNAELVEHIVALCKERGLKQDRGETVGSYKYSAARIYEPSDLEAAELLFLAGGRGYLRDANRNEQGLLVIPASQASPSLKLKAVFPAPWIVVSDSVRHIFEAAGLEGLAFRETLVCGRSARAAKEPLWELTSPISLPRILNSVRYETSTFECYGIDDDSYQRPEIHYRQSELHALGTFDIARTREPLGDRDPSLIVSRRFYRCCLDRRIPVDVWPVRIDPT